MDSVKNTIAIGCTQFIFAYFGCHGNAICSLTNSDSLINFANSENRVVHIKCLDRTKICAILAYFCLNLVVMGTPFAPLKIQITYLKSLTPKTLRFAGKNSRFLAQN